MLIKALSDYYDILASKGEITPEGFSKVKIHYKVALTEDGKIDEIIDFRKKDTIKTGKDKIKEIIAPVSYTHLNDGKRGPLENPDAAHRGWKPGSGAL